LAIGDGWRQWGRREKLAVRCSSGRRAVGGRRGMAATAAMLRSAEDGVAARCGSGECMRACPG
jgi:hypothetical protein